MEFRLSEVVPGTGLPLPFLICNPRAASPKSSQSSPATSPPTEAIPLSETSCAAARTHARPVHTNASPREPRRSSARCSKPVSPLHCPRGYPPPAAKRRRRLAGDRNIGIQRKMFIGSRRMTYHKLSGTLVGIPFCRGKRQMSRIDSHREIRAAAFFVCGIHGVSVVEFDNRPRPVYRFYNSL